MKFLILPFTLFLLSSLAVNAQDIDKGHLLAMQNTASSEVVNLAEKALEPAAKPANELDKASIKMIDDLTEKLYLERKKRWQKEIGTLSMN